MLSFILLLLREVLTAGCKGWVGEDVVEFDKRGRKETENIGDRRIKGLAESSDRCWDVSSTLSNFFSP